MVYIMTGSREICMKRTQLYIEDDVIKTLRRVSKEKAVSISELVRAAVRKTYSLEKPDDADMILREAAGIWKDRKDIRGTVCPADEKRHEKGKARS
jgi:rRNA-processing protein FCF1